MRAENALLSKRLGSSAVHHSLSVFIIAKNEEAHIADVIEAVIAWANEVIVLDSG
jgi:hypothetical protein